MSKTGAESKKQLLTIGALGADEAGKTTLTAAITKVLALRRWADFRQVDQLGNAPEDKTRGFTPVKYESESRQYTHVDFADHRSYIKNILRGAVRLDGAILVVDAADGPMPQTHEQVRLARYGSVPALVVFYNKVELADEEVIELSQFELNKLLARHGYTGDNAPVICGSALRVLECASSDPNAEEYACIWDLLRAVDAYLPTPTPLADRPFLMPIEDVFMVKDRGTLVNGWIECGQVKVGDEIEIVGLRSTRKTTVVGMTTFHNVVDQGRAGDNVGCVLRGIDRNEIQRGMVLAKPGSITPWRKFEAECYVFTKEEGGRHTPIFSRQSVECSLRTATVNARIQLPEKVVERKELIPGMTGGGYSVRKVEEHAPVMPGNSIQLSVELVEPVALRIGDYFTLREGKVTIGAGIITNVNQLEQEKHNAAERR